MSTREILPAAGPLHGGRRKAALALAALGPAVSARVFEHLDADEVEQITAEMAGLRTVDAEERDGALLELGEHVAANRWAAVEGPRHAGALPGGAEPSGRPAPGPPLDLLPRDGLPVTATPAGLLRHVRATPPERLHRLIRYAPVDTIALILAHLDPPDACAVLGNLPATTQVDVAERIAWLDRTAPELVREAGRMLDAAEPDA